jgi:hypothetical protein
MKINDHEVIGVIFNALLDRSPPRFARISLVILVTALSALLD